jgi:hypothetical protein
VRLYLPRAVGAVKPPVQQFTTPGQLPRENATVLLVEDAI